MDRGILRTVAIEWILGFVFLKIYPPASFFFFLSSFILLVLVAIVARVQKSK